MDFQLSFIFQLLPLLTKSKNVRPNYPSSFFDDDDDEKAQSPYLDQIAQADTWKSDSNRVISAKYTGDPQTGESKFHRMQMIDLVKICEKFTKKRIRFTIDAFC